MFHLYMWLVETLLGVPLIQATQLNRGHLVTIDVVATLYILTWLFLVWNCLSSEEGIDRLTWLVVLLTIPLFGPIFYFVHAIQRMQREDASAIR